MHFRIADGDLPALLDSIEQSFDDGVPERFTARAARPGAQGTHMADAPVGQRWRIGAFQMSVELGDTHTDIVSSQHVYATFGVGPLQSSPGRDDVDFVGLRAVCDQAGVPCRMVIEQGHTRFRLDNADTDAFFEALDDDLDHDPGDATLASVSDQR